MKLGRPCALDRGIDTTLFSLWGRVVHSPLAASILGSDKHGRARKLILALSRSSAPVAAYPWLQKLDHLHSDPGLRSPITTASLVNARASIALDDLQPEAVRGARRARLDCALHTVPRACLLTWPLSRCTQDLVLCAPGERHLVP